MKRKHSAWLLGLLMLGLFLCIPATGSAASLNLSNGGFENGFTNWTKMYNGLSERNSFHSEGSYSLKLLDGNVSQVGYASEKLEARPGVVYTAKAKSYVKSGSGLLIIRFYDEAGNQIDQNQYSNGTAGSGTVWTQMNVSMLAPAGTESVNVILYTNSGTVYFDEVSVEEQVVDGNVVTAELSANSPIQDVTVNLYAQSDTLYQTSLGGATTDSNGEFSLYVNQVLPNGTYVLRAVKNEYAETVDIPIDASGHSGLTIRLRPNADTYFTNSPGWFHNFVPGVINPNEGTIELKVEIDRPYEELGNEYDFIFQMAPRKPVGNTMLSMYTPVVWKPSQIEDINDPSKVPLETSGLSALLVNQQTGSPSVRLSATDDEFKGRYNLTDNCTHMLAMTWAQGAPLRLYVDGVEVASSGSSLQQPISPELLPYHFQISTFSPFKTKAVRISTKAIGAASLHIDPETALLKTSDTSLLSNDMITVRRYASANMSDYSIVMPADRPEKKSYVAGEWVVVPFVSVNHATADRTFQITIDAFDEKGVTAGSIVNYSITVPADGRQRIHEIPFPAIGNQGQGYYSLDITVTQVSSIPNTSVSYESAVAVLPANEANVADGAMQSYYGQHYTSEMDLSIMLDMGVKATRAWEARAKVFAWHSLEPQDDQWRWDAADRYVAHSRQAGMDIIGVLGNPPRWAAQRPTFRDEDPTNGDKVKVTEYSVLPQRWVPTSIAEWREYVGKTVDRFKDKVEYWEIYNEANFNYDPKAGTLVEPAAFTGTSEQYFELLGAAYEEIQKINVANQLTPNFTPIKVLTTGFSAAGGADPDMPAALLDSDNDYYDKFHIFNVHGYTGASVWSTLPIPQNTPKWMTEQAWLWDTVQSRRMFRTVESFLDFLGNGYQRFYHFGLSTLLFDRYTLSPQPDYYVAGVFQNRMRKVDSYEGVLDFEGSEAFSIKHTMLRTNGTYLSVIGSRYGGYNIKVNNPSAIVSVTDLYGRTVPHVPTLPDTYNTGVDNVLYVISTEPLDIQDDPVLTQIGELVYNGDFQDIGDPFAGLSLTKPNGWTYNNTPANGSFTVVDQGVGDYAIEVNKTGSGNLFLSQDVVIPKPGNYQLTVTFRRVGTDTSFTAWAFFKDRDEIYPYSPDTEEGEDLLLGSDKTLTVDLNPQAPVNNGVIGFGFLGSGTGTVQIDDVKLEYMGP